MDHRNHIFCQAIAFALAALAICAVVALSIASFPIDSELRRAAITVSGALIGHAAVVLFMHWIDA